jgi:UDP-glucuronate 4-epimerase
MKILVTGTAGFIGFYLVERLIKEGYDVYGLDVINDYYDIDLKCALLAQHGIPRLIFGFDQPVKSAKYPNYIFIRLDLADHDTIVNFMVEQKFDYVLNLAAQAGVCYSIDNPRA